MFNPAVAARGAGAADRDYVFRTPRTTLAAFLAVVHRQPYGAAAAFTEPL
ncbi:hypothetical protein [Mycobacteroides abscessus]|nr:hypothetical protein [Mycobacteroides abscessus]